MLLSGGDYWFLYVLFEVYLIFPLLDLVREKTKAGFCVFLIVFIILSEQITCNIFCVNYVVYYIPFFMLGVILRDVGICDYSEKSWNLSLDHTGWLIFWGLSGLYCLRNFYQGVGNNLLHVAGCLAWFSVLLLLVRGMSENNLLKKYFSVAGKYSLQLYLFNGYLLVIFRELLVTICKITNPYIILAVISVTNCAGAILIVKYIVTKVKVLSRLCGIGERGN